MKSMSILPLGIHSQTIKKGWPGWVDDCGEKKGECMENLVNDIMRSLFRTYAFHIANHNMPWKQILHSHSKHFVLIKVTSFG